MVVNIFINNKHLTACEDHTTHDELCATIQRHTNLQREDFYLLCHGKRFLGAQVTGDVHCMLRQVGGKGGFGSMLRAIGAQIEKTTNREACRDLSGRRLRDINEEKRLRSWLEKQGEREREAEERKKRKIEKLLAVPKHDFKDEEYEESRANLTEKVNDAFEEGLKQAEELKEKQQEEPSSSGTKRRAPVEDKSKAKKKKGALWIGDDISGSDSDSDSEEETQQKKAIKS